MDEKTAKRLRLAFPADRIGKLPKLTCPACREDRSKQCQNHPKTRCNTCGNWISTAHTHLDYVGHADITDRFLEVDPAWSWEPVARDIDPQVVAAATTTNNPDVLRQVLESAPPKLDGHGGLWIRLTIAGVTRLGYGDGGGKRGPDAIKVAIGDALRNAGMRFGTGLDMWRKDLDPGDSSPAPQEQRTNPSWLTGMESRITEATSEQELLTLAHEIEAKVQGGFCEQTHYEQLWHLGEARLREVQQAAARPAPVSTDTDRSPAGPLTAAEAFAARLETAQTIEALGELKAEVMAAFKNQEFGPTEGNELLRAIKNKQHTVGTSAP